MGKAIGIDLGTTNSVVAFKDVTVRTRMVIFWSVTLYLIHGKDMHLIL